MSDRLKFKFLVERDSDKSISKEFSIEDLIEMCGDEDILDSLNQCDCALSEGNPVCEGECVPDYDEEKIVGKVQFSGLKDKENKDIYESDIILLNAYGDDLIAPVIWNEDNSEFMLEHPNGYHGHYGFTWKIIDSCQRFEVIGNLFLNPELMKAKK